MNTTQHTVNTPHIAANTTATGGVRRTRKDGTPDRRYNDQGTDRQVFLIIEDGRDVASVEATSTHGAMQRAAFHLGVNIRDAKTRWSVIPA